MADIDWGIVIASIAVVIAIAGTVVSGILTRASNKITRQSAEDAKKMNEATILLSLEEKFLHPDFYELQGAITTRSPILKTNGGFLDDESILYRYFSIYETIYGFVTRGLMTEDTIFGLYGTSIVVAYEHPEIAEWIRLYRKKFPGAWRGFVNLGKLFKIKIELKNKSSDTA